MIYGSAMRPRRGERVSGDAVLVRHAGRRLLFAVIDGLGHGEAAHHVAELGVETLIASDLALPVAEQMDGLHDALRGTRGAAATLGTLEDNSLEITGVGNVDLRCRFGYIPFAPSPGIVGVNLRRIRTTRVDLPSQARFFVLSDGISRRLDVTTVDRLPPPEATQSLLERYGNPNDDASILCICAGRPVV
jgi:negative regulator of sigma-B (phosphoserine phosphatase)